MKCLIAGIVVVLSSVGFAAEDTKLGAGVNLKESTPIKALVDKPGDYVGKTVRVDVTVWGFSPGFADSLDLYYTATAPTPTWIYVGTVRSAQAGLQTLSMSYSLPAGALQAVRARYRQVAATICRDELHR